MITRAILCICICILTISVARSQETLPSWGQIDEKVLAFTEYEEDPDAKAIILFDYGEVYFNNNLELVFKRHRRVKILDPDESEYTDVMIQHNPRQRVQTLSNLRAQTLNLDSNGKVRSERLGRREFYEERFSDNVRLTRFTFPDLRPGSVVEYSYTIKSKHATFLRDWYFQNSEPTLHSEFVAHIPDYFLYVRQIRGYKELDIQQSTPYPIGFNITNDHFTGTSGYKHHWISYNAPAVRKEPYITTVDDYRSMIRFQLSEIRHPSVRSQNFMGTWQQLVEELLEHSDLGRQVNANRDIRKKVAELTAGLETDIEMARALYDNVAKSLVWNERRGLLTDVGVRKAFEQNAGNGPELSLLLVTMLREAGIQADPVLLSTRANGAVFWQYPLIGQFNHIIVAAEIDDETYLLEPLHRDIPFGTLHPQSLNGNGFVINQENSRQIELVNRNPQTTRTLMMVNLDKNGGVNGQIQLSYTGYTGLQNRQRVRDSGNETFVNDWLLDDLPETRVLSVDVRGMDDNERPLIIMMEMENSAYAMQAGDMIYINPFMVNRLKENPLRLRSRSFPVDFNYTMDHTHTLTMNIPEGYTVEEMPGNSGARVGQDATYHQIAQQIDSVIQLTARLQINTLVFPPSRYDELRTFYDDVVSMQSTRLVLRKIGEEDENLE